MFNFCKIIKYRYRKSKFNKFLIIIAIFLTLSISIGYSRLKESLTISSSAKFSPIPVLKATTSSDKTAFRSSTYKENIKTITFEDEINVPDTATESWGSIFKLDVSNFDTSKVDNMSSMFRETGYNSTVFTLDVSGFDTSKVTDVEDMFYQTGYNSTKLKISITIRNPNTTSYTDMFYDVATKEDSQITVNYTSETSDLVVQMIATKSENSNVVKDVQVD